MWLRAKAGSTRSHLLGWYCAMALGWSASDGIGSPSFLYGRPALSAEHPGAYVGPSKLRELHRLRPGLSENGGEEPGGSRQYTTMSPQFLTALRKLVETLDKHQAGSRYLLGLAALASTTALLLAWLGARTF